MSKDKDTIEVPRELLLTLYTNTVLLKLGLDPDSKCHQKHQDAIDQVDDLLKKAIPRFNPGYFTVQVNTQLRAKAKNYKHLVEQLELRNRLLKEQNEVLLRANRDRAKTIESLRRLLPG